MKRIEFTSSGNGPVTSVLVDGKPWNNVLCAGLIITSGATPKLSLDLNGHGADMIFEGVTVIVRNISVQLDPENKTGKYT